MIVQNIKQTKVELPRLEGVRGMGVGVIRDLHLHFLLALRRGPGKLVL